MRLRLATGNAGKVRELRALLEPRGFTLEPAPAGFAVDEDGDTFEANAIKKAQALVTADANALADDSGLVVDALGGAPGVHSARYAGVSGPGQDAANRRKLLEALAAVPAASRTARFVCVIAYCAAGQAPRLFRGEVEGHISLAEAGAHGFGYDPLFIPAGESRTFAELPAEVKHRLSHRGRAVRAFADALPCR